MDLDWFEKEQLHFAARDGDLRRVRELVSEGRPVNVFDETGRTPLHYAAENEHLEIVRFLIESGADINAQEEATLGNTPVAGIADKCSPALAKLLIDAGADPTIRGWQRLNALDRARDRTDGEGLEVYKLLLKAARGC
jgi:ankyrin repeat protein